MNLKDPVVVFAGETEANAHVIQAYLLENSIEATVVEDQSQDGANVFGGTLADPKPPQVWVEKDVYEKARALVMQFAEQIRQHQEQEKKRLENAEPIPVECDSCLTVTKFAAIQHGTVQVCPKCQAFLDVGDDEPFDDWKIEEPDGET